MSETVNYRGYEIKIESDSHGFHPRNDQDNGGTMVTFLRNYTVGDTDHGFENGQELMDFINSDECLAALPIFAYIHSGITISTGGFSCQWDSGQAGMIFIDQAGCDKIGYDESWREHNYPELSMKEALEKVLEAEVKEMDMYLTEGCYYYSIEEVDDSCGGFLGFDHKKSGLLEYAENAIDCHIQHKLEKRLEKLKEYIKAKVPVIYRTLPSL